MDKAEAIKILEYERDTDIFVSNYRNRVHEALDLAIEALQLENMEDDDCCSWEGEDILDIVYPIGTYVFGAVVGDPNETFGGVWEELECNIFKRIE